MNLDNKVLTINNKEYLVISTVKYVGHQYVYLVNKNDESDALFREVVEENNSLFLREIDKDLFKNKIFDLFSDEMTNI